MPFLASSPVYNNKWPKNVHPSWVHFLAFYFPLNLHISLLKNGQELILVHALPQLINMLATTWSKGTQTYIYIHIYVYKPTHTPPPLETLYGRQWRGEVLFRLFPASQRQRRAHLIMNGLKMVSTQTLTGHHTNATLGADFWKGMRSKKFERMTLPSSHSPSLPSLPLPLQPPTPWLFLRCCGRGRTGLAWGGVQGHRGGRGGAPSNRHLGPHPHLVRHSRNSVFRALRFIQWPCSRSQESPHSMNASPQSTFYSVMSASMAASSHTLFKTSSHATLRWLTEMGQVQVKDWLMQTACVTPLPDVGAPLPGCTLTGVFCVRLSNGARFCWGFCAKICTDMCENEALSCKTPSIVPPFACHRQSSLVQRGFFRKHESMTCLLELALTNGLLSDICTCRWDLQQLSLCWRHHHLPDHGDEEKHKRSGEQIPKEKLCSDSLAGKVC